MKPAPEKELLAEITRRRTELEKSRLENQLLREKFNLMLALCDDNYTYPLTTIKITH
jgi:hypothetical protein